ncbi:MAG: DNA polymerase/3'-5' exonuclease PolX [Candidatus Aenigmatarchaeota archaeon]
MRNKEIADIFYEMADLLDAQGVQWKPAAYRKAARSVESLPEPVEDVYARGGVKALRGIAGVGEGIAAKIEEYLKTGKIREFERIRSKVPAAVTALMGIEGMGPKRAILLHKKLKINSIADLKKAVEQHKISRLQGFGPKSEQNIAENIRMFERGHERMLLGEALPLARSIIGRLKKLKEVKQIQYAGSIRRGKETIGDIDILATSSKPGKVMDTFVSLPEVSRVLAKGPTKSTVILKNNRQADVRVLHDREFGAALQYFTGSKDHNIALRKIAIAKSYKLSEYGLLSRRTGAFVAGRTEEEIYRKLGLRYIEPELRENSGEIEAAKAGKLPQLVKLSDIKGDLQMHTKWSDGSNTIEEMAQAARALGYGYICITDHSKSEHIAHGMDEQRLEKYIEAVRLAAKKFRDIKILVGAEVDILADGSLDYPDDILKRLNLVIAAVHTGFKQPAAAMTRRVLKALENKNVDIFGHPTGRIINVRNPINLNIGEVIKVAAARGVVLEVDALPERLDLKDTDVREAVEHGCKIAIDTDAHDKNQLRYMEYGVLTARRGWAEAKDVVNTYPYGKLKKVFRKLR